MPTRCLILWYAFPVSILLILPVPSSQYFLSHGESDTDAPFRFEHSTGRLWLKTCIGNLTYRIFFSFSRKEFTFTYSYIHVYMYVYMKTYINTWFYSYLYKIICIHAKIYIYPNMLLYTHKYTYTYIFKVVYFFHGIIFLSN